MINMFEVGLSEQEWESQADEARGIALRSALRITGNYSDAEDAAQQALLETWINRTRIRGGRLGGVSYDLGRKRGMDIIRSNKSKCSQSLDDTQTHIPDKDRHTDPQLTLLEKESNERAQMLLLQLPPNQRAVVALSIIQGFSQEEISDTLNRPLGTVKSQNSRGVARLRRFIHARE